MRAEEDARLEPAAGSSNPLQGIPFPEMKPIVVRAVGLRSRGRQIRTNSEVYSEGFAVAEATTLDPGPCRDAAAGWRPKRTRAL